MFKVQRSGDALVVRCHPLGPDHTTAHSRIEPFVPFQLPQLLHADRANGEVHEGDIDPAIKMAINTAMMEMTTRSSMRVNPFLIKRPVLVGMVGCS